MLKVKNILIEIIINPNIKNNFDVLRRKILIISRAVTSTGDYY